MRRAPIAGLVVVGALAVVWALMQAGLFGVVPSIDPRSDPTKARGDLDAAARRMSGLRAELPAVPGLAAAPRIGDGRLRGRLVRFADRAAAAGAVLRLAGTSLEGPEVRLRAASAPDGTFRFEAVPAGAVYALRIETRDGAIRSVSPIAVLAERTTDLGTVYLGGAARIAGIVVDAGGGPLADALVALYPQRVGGAAAARWSDGLERDIPVLARAQSAADGRFELPLAPADTYVLVVRALGRVAHVRRVTVAGGREETPALRIVLARGEALQGVVETKGGRPVADAVVVALPSDDALRRVYGRITTRTGPDGRFRIDARDPEVETELVLAVPGAAVQRFPGPHADPVRLRVEAGDD